MKRWLEALRARPRTAAVAAAVVVLGGWWGFGALGNGETGKWVRVERDELVLAPPAIAG